MSCEDMSTPCGVCDVDKLYEIVSVLELTHTLEKGILQAAPYKSVHGFVAQIPETVSIATQSLSCFSDVGGDQIDVFQL